MGSILVQIVANFSYLISWPSLSFAYPLYASIRAIEIDEESSYQQCLRYWVLFAMATIFEWMFSKILVWFSWWPYLKGIALAVFALPSFACASYVYSKIVRPHVAKDSSFHDEFPILEANKSLQIEPYGIFDFESEMYGRGGDNGVTCKDESVGSYSTTKMILSHPLFNIKEVQREWSCPLCLFSTTKEKRLRKHFRTKKHEMKQQEHLQNYVVDDLLATKQPESMVSRFNEITWNNYEKISYLINPVFRASRCLRWMKPEYGWIKLNTDGSIDKKISKFGGLFRDNQGNALCAYIGKAPGDDIFCAELWAIWRGLVLALGLGINDIWVESDSMSVVKTIKKEQGYGHKASGCLMHMWILLSKFERYCVSHSWRETNRAADFLSKMVILESDKVLWPSDFPSSLTKIIEEDAQGKTYFRRF